jgi:L,D-transpeptidase catalytic domain
MSNVTITRPLAAAQAEDTSEVRPSPIRMRGGERRCSWTRGLAVLGTAIAALQIGSAGASTVPAGETASRPGLDAKSPATGSHGDAAWSGRAHRPRPPAAASDVRGNETASAEQPAAPEALSDQEERVGQIAVENGDQVFVMVDKALGKIILFENGKPVFSGAALTGESTADRLPPGALAERFSQMNALKDKVTPAGRYTVSRGHDDAYGTLLDVNEIRGRDWGIAIHKVYLGIPSEHRDARLRSPNEEDRHITFGCINVTPTAIQYLLRELPARRPTPLYILPLDNTKTAAYFTPRNS